MSQPNKIAITIPPDVEAKIKEAILTLEDAFDKILITLKPEERRMVPKMGNETFSFVSKTAGYIEANPEFVPPFLNVEDFNVDFKVIATLLPFARAIEQLHGMLEDTITLAGSEAYIAALIYYQSVKTFAKNDVIHSKEISVDLGERCPQHRKPKKDDTIDPLMAQ